MYTYIMIRASKISMTYIKLIFFYVRQRVMYCFYIFKYENINILEHFSTQMGKNTIVFKYKFENNIKI